MYGKLILKNLAKFVPSMTSPALSISTGDNNNKYIYRQGGQPFYSFLSISVKNLHNKNT